MTHNQNCSSPRSYRSWPFSRHGLHVFRILSEVRVDYSRESQSIDVGKYRHERSWRVAIFFGGAALAGAFGGVLAYIIGKMDGIGGRKGWQWYKMSLAVRHENIENNSLGFLSSKEL